LEPLLGNPPANADLWLSSGWPVRAARPACRRWVLRVDWEYGALPVELTPHVTQGADVVVVHSEHVRRTVTASGRAPASVRVVPHGVDAAMHEQAPPDRDVLAFKNGRPAVLFCGGLVWRKGFDVFLRAALAAKSQGHDFVVVVKSVGGDQHYGRFHLAELVERFRRTAGTPPLLWLDRDMTRAELASTYTACDVLLHPYRGEGFCLPVLEARACGLPVLATAGGATDQLMHGPGAFPIAAERRAVELPGPHVSAPWVLEPSSEATVTALVDVLGDLDGHRRAAHAAAGGVRDAFSWDAAAQAIERLAANEPAPDGAAEPVVVATPAPGRGRRRAVPV
jgi:glycosyltransferase involved in cell wall biosynthesis